MEWSHYTNPQQQSAVRETNPSTRRDNQWTREIRRLLRQGDRHDRIDAEALWAAIEGARFYRAGVYEPRGLSDVGLTLREWQLVASFNLPYEAHGQVVEFLDA